MSHLADENMQVLSHAGSDSDPTYLSKCATPDSNLGFSLIELTSDPTTGQSTASTVVENRRRTVLNKPHIAFMQRRTKTKPRITSSKEKLANPVLVVQMEDDLSQMKPFAPGPDPHFLLMQRYRQRQVSTTRGYRLSIQRKK